MFISFKVLLWLLAMQTHSQGTGKVLEKREIDLSWSSRCACVLYWIVLYFFNSLPTPVKGLHPTPVKGLHPTPVKGLHPTQSRQTVAGNQRSQRGTPKSISLLILPSSLCQGSCTWRLLLGNELCNHNFFLPHIYIHSVLSLWLCWDLGPRP